MLRKPAHFIIYLSTLQKPAARAGFCNVLKYKADTFYLSTIQKPAPYEQLILKAIILQNQSASHFKTQLKRPQNETFFS